MYGLEKKDYREFYIEYAVKANLEDKCAVSQFSNT